MKVALYHVYTIEDQMSELINEKQCALLAVPSFIDFSLIFLVFARTLEKAVERGEKAHSMANARKLIYAKVGVFFRSWCALGGNYAHVQTIQIAALWPEDVMTTNQLSREMSQMKKKMEKEKERENEKE